MISSFDISDEELVVKSPDSAIRKLGTVYRWDVARLLDVARITLLFHVSAIACHRPLCADLQATSVLAVLLGQLSDTAADLAFMLVRLHLFALAHIRIKMSSPLSHYQTSKRVFKHFETILR